MNSQARRAVKVALSVFVAYHVFCVALLPNSASILGRRLDAILTPYANPFIFNRTWQFFSPGPMPSFYLEYEIVTPENEMDLMRETKFYPVRPSSFTLSDLYLRSLGGMRFLGVKDEHFTRFFIPFLCRQHPEAKALDVRSVIEEVPPIEKIGDEQSSIGFREMAERTDLPRRLYDCPGHEVSFKEDIENEIEKLGEEE